MKLNGIGFEGTRYSNTGLDSQNPLTPPSPNKKTGYEVSVDYLTITAYFTSGLGMWDIIHLVENCLGEKFTFSATLGSWDGKSYKGSSSDSLHGTRLYTNPPGMDRASGEIRIKIPGKALAATSMREVRDMAIILREQYMGVCSRFDGAIDDYSKTINLDEVKKAQDLGNFAYVETIGYHESGERGGKDKGRTITFGSRQSQSYLRIYDKNVQSHGVIDAIRYEVEFKDEKADSVFESWCDFDFQDEQGAAKVIAGATLGAVRFCDRSSGDKNLDRCDDLPWYEKLCNSVVSGFRLRVRKKERFLDSSIEWVKKAVMPTLAMIRKYMGDDVFLQWVYDETDEQMSFLSPIKLEKIEQQKERDKEQQQYTTTTEFRTDMRKRLFDEGLYWD